MTKIKDISEALSIFQEAAINHAEATMQGNYKACNKNYALIVEAVSFLKKKNEIKALLELLKHSSAGVRSWAATYLLPVFEKEAIEALNELVKRNDIHALDAETTLSEWKKGNLKL